MRAGDREEDASLPSKADPTTDPPREDEHTASGANASTTTTTTTTTTGVAGGKRSAPGPSKMGAPRTAPRYLLRIQYDGTNFHGFQRQANARTVQGVVEDALGAFAGGGGKGKGAHEPIRTCGSSRTDAGVHALDNTVHVDLSRVSNRKPSGDARALPPHKPHTIVAAVNHFLKKTAPDARLTGCVRVDPQKFHARFSATGRTYHYRMHVSPTPPSLFERGRVWHVSSGNGTGVMVGGGGGGGEGSGVKGGDGDWGLDLEAMRAAAAHLVGERDFSTFRASGCQASSPVRTLWDIRVDAAPSWPPFPAAAIESARPDDFSRTRVIDEDEDEDGIGHERRKKRTKTGGVDGGTTGARRCGPLTRGGVVITVSGPSFLYHQVRLMVSTLRAVGAGTVDPDDVPALLARKTPAAVPAMAPAHGLYLGRVHYDGTREWSPRTEGEAPAEGGDE